MPFTIDIVENSDMRLYSRSAQYSDFLWPTSNNNDNPGTTTGNSNFSKVVSDGEQTISKDSTTTFVADANIVSVVPSNYSTIPDSMVRAGTTNFPQDITSFLQKPVTLQTGILQTTDTVSSFAEIDLPYELIWAATLTNANKLQGFLGFKADLRIRFIINGTRFQRGRYKLAWVANAGAPGDNAGTNYWFDAHFNTLVQRTQLPGIELDVNCDTEGEMVIPYCSFLNYYPVSVNQTPATNYGSAGILKLFPYSTLSVAVPPGQCAYRIMGNFENIQLFTPATPQMGRVSYASKGNKSVSEAEKESAGVGPFSSALTAVSRASASLAVIPPLSAYMTGVSWATDILSKTASAFGFSKPITNMATVRNLPQIAPYMGNIDAVDQSLPLSMSIKNEVANLPGFASSDNDELSFAFISTIPAWFQSTNWTTAQANGVLLTEFSLCPVLFNTQSTVHTQTIVNYTPIAFVSSFFRFWRGSLCFKIKFVKTEFHSGRLAVAFFPRVDMNAAAAATRTLDSSNFVHREIVDIRLQNEINISVPFTSITPFLGANEPMGHLSIFIFDKLVAPDTVSDTCTLLCEVSAGYDMEWAELAPSGLAPTLNIAPQMDVSNVCELTNTAIGSSSVTRSSVENAEYCIGEKVVSFRSLLKMSRLNPVQAANVLTATNWLQIYPYMTTYYWSQTPNVFYKWIPDLYSVLSSIYVLQRGGMRFKLINANPPLGFKPITAFYRNVATTNLQAQPFNYVNTIDGVDSPILENNAVISMTSNTNSVLEVQVPQYSSTHSRNSIMCMSAGAALNMATARPNYSSYILITATGSTAANSSLFHIYRSVADDFQMGGFVSIPPMKIVGFSEYAAYPRA
nr:MAG: capsid protein [Picornaviridae sp.]